MTTSKIEWTDRVWNPVTGCTKVSAGCKNCYAETFAGRGIGSFSGGRKFTDVRTHADRLDVPLRWRKPQRVFVASMSDPFHDAVPTDFLDRIFAVMAMAPRHSYQLLTKRPDRMRTYVTDPQAPFRVQKAIDAIAVDEAMRSKAEQWRPVVSSPSYEVSTLGRVRRASEELRLVHHSGGYRQVALCENGEPATRLVHELVLEAFDRRRQHGDEVRHRNGDKADNRLANLSWGTKAENMQDASRHGTAGAWMRGRAKLSPETVREIRDLRKRGGRLVEIARRFDITKQQVSAIARGDIYKEAKLQWPLPSLWLGVSCEDQHAADERIPLLLQTPAAVRFVSAEPLLGPIRMDQLHDDEIGARWTAFRPKGMDGPRAAVNSRGESVMADSRDAVGIDWVIAGGESGPGARQCNVEWIRGIVEQCKATGVACFVKQLGTKPLARDRWDMAEHVFQAADAAGWDEASGPIVTRLRDRKGGDPSEWPEYMRVREFPAEASR